MDFVLPNNPDGSNDWKNGNRSAGVKGSPVQYQAFTQSMEELTNAVEQAGLTPSQNDLRQVWQAIRTGACIPVVGRSATQPGSPAIGDTWIVMPAATGSWSGQDNKLANWQSPARGVAPSWHFWTPRLGAVASYLENSLLVSRYWDGTNWKRTGGTTDSSGFTNATQPTLKAKSVSQSAGLGLAPLLSWTVDPNRNFIGDATFNTANASLTAGPESAGWWKMELSISASGAMNTTWTIAAYNSGSTPTGLAACTAYVLSSGGFWPHGQMSVETYLNDGDVLSHSYAYAVSGFNVIGDITFTRTSKDQ